MTGVNDNVPIVPGPWVEWREVIEYTASIALAFVTGNILGFLIIDVLPKTVTQGGGKPNPLAYKAAGLLVGRHVGAEHLRRRARIIQDLMTTAGPHGGYRGDRGRVPVCRSEGRYWRLSALTHREKFA